MPPPPPLPDRIRLPFEFDSVRLAADLEALQPQWVRHFVPANYEGEWTVFPLRAPAGETHPVRMIGAGSQFTEFADTVWLEQSPYFREVLAQFHCPLRAVRLMRLAPGSRIKEHCDPFLGVEDGSARLHIPIATSDAVEFLLNGTAVAMAPGSCWYLRLSDMHSVTNSGSDDRVHLVVDADANDWLCERLAAAAQASSASA